MASRQYGLKPFVFGRIFLLREKIGFGYEIPLLFFEIRAAKILWQLVSTGWI